MHRLVLAITLLLPGLAAAAPDAPAPAPDVNDAPVAQADDPEQPPLGPGERTVGRPGAIVIDDGLSVPPPVAAHPYATNPPSPYPPAYPQMYSYPSQYPQTYPSAYPYPQACPYPQGCAPPACAPSPGCCAAPCGAYPNLQPRSLADWHFVVDPDGSWWRERQVKKGNGGLIAGGLILWLSTYVATAYSGIMIEGVEGIPSLVPLAGPFFSAAWAGAEGNGGAATLYVLSGLTQVSGFIMMIAGSSHKKLQIERQRVTWGAAVVPGGAGSSVTVRF